MRAKLYNLNNCAVPCLSRAAPLPTCVGTSTTLVTIYGVVQNRVSGDKNTVLTHLNKFRFNNNFCDPKRQ